MNGVVVDYVPVVRAGNLKEPAQLKCIDRVENQTFFKLCKNDTAVERLLLGKCTHNKRMLAYTDIVETIQDLRNQKVLDIVEPPPADDLGLDEPRAKRVKLKELPDDVPKIICIKAPAVNHISGIDMRVLSGVSRQQLYVELVASNTST